MKSGGKVKLWLGSGLLLVVLLWSVGGIGCSPTDPGTNNDGGTADTATGTDTAGKDTTGVVTDTSTPKDDTTSQPDKPTSSTYNWYKHVQPIIQESCQSCHTAGGVAPFALTNYEEVKSKATAVKFAVKNRTMPPWSPTDENDCKKFAHSRRLTNAQVDTISKWVDEGTVMGDPNDGKTFQPKVDKLDSIDAEVDIQVDYTPPATRPDDYHCFMTKPVVTGTAGKEMTGFQLIPGVREMVHHVLIYSVNASYAKTLEGQYPNKHWGCSTGSLFNTRSFGSTTLLGVWVPGTDVVRFPKDTGMAMKPGDQLVLEFHYNLSSMKAPKPDRTKIRLQYAKTPVKHKIQLSLQLQFQFAIPPKSKDHKVTNTQTIPNDVRVWGIMPHMHKLGSKFKIDLFPGGGINKECFVDIPRWDYNWQQTYFFNSPTGILLKKGDKTFMTCSFTNPGDDTITWGDRTGDEMCLNFYFVSAP